PAGHGVRLSPLTTLDRKIAVAAEPAEPLGAAVTAAMTPCEHWPVTLVLGHVWITIRRRYGRDRLRVFLAALPSTAFSLVTEGGPPGSSSPATSHAPHRHPAYFQVHRQPLCTAPALVISPGLA